MDTAEDLSASGGNMEIVRRLLRVISRQLPLAAADELLDDHVVAHMDGKKIAQGKSPWRRWVRFLHYCADKKMSELAVAVETIGEENGDKVAVRARWQGVIGGETTLSDVGTVVYQLRGGKIINIWTHKANYIFIHGKGVVRPPVFAFLLLRIMWRSLLSGGD